MGTYVDDECFDIHDYDDDTDHDTDDDINDDTDDDTDDGGRGNRRPLPDLVLEASGKKKKHQNADDPSGSIRDITAHLIHDKNTSIEVSCTVFNFPSAGNDPRWIHWSYEFLFFR